MRRSSASSRNDIHDTAKGVGPIKGRTGAADKLDSIRIHDHHVSIECSRVVLNARCVVKSHPTTTFISAHVASNAEDLAAVSQWQFTPTIFKGSPVAVIMTVTVNFTLK